MSKHTDARIARHMEALRKRVIDQCRVIGIDVEAIPTDDKAVIKASAVLREILRVAKADGKPKRRPRFHSEPTPERRAKAERMVEIEIHKDQPRAHATIWPPDQMSTSLTLAEHSAAERLRIAFYASQGKSPVVNLHGNGGGASRGLEPTERQVQGLHEYRFLMTRLRSSLNEAHVECARNFILELPMRPGDPRPLTWVEFGRLHGNPGDDGAARWLARGALKACCVALAAAAKELDGERADARRRAG